MRRLLPVLILMFGVACAGGPSEPGLVTDISPATQATEPPPPQPSAIPRPAATPTLSSGIRLVLLSVDGARYEQIAGWTLEGKMPALAQALEEARWGAVSPESAATSSAAGHATLACACLPTEHGILNERLHLPGDSFYWYTSAYDLPFAGGQTIWSAARDRGLLTAALFWPGASIDLPEQMADLTVDYGEQLAYSDLKAVPLYAPPAWEGVELPPEAREGQLVLSNRDGTLAIIYLLALPDQIVFSLDRRLDDSDARLDADDWASLPLSTGGRMGVRVKVQEHLGEQVMIYHSGVYLTEAAPDEFRAALIDSQGFFPPPPDYYALEAGWITPGDFMHMLRVFSDWQMGVTTWVYEQYKPDLLLSVQSPLKQGGHQFTLEDARQPGYSAARAEEYAGYMADAATQLDQVYATLRSTLEADLASGDTALLLAAPAGMTPIHSRVNLNALLRQQGYLALDSRGYVVTSASRAFAMSSGGSGSIHINLTLRDPGGIVAEMDYPALLAELNAYFDGVSDPATGELVFVAVLASPLDADADAASGLGGPYGGDLTLFAAPGYLLDDDRDAYAAFEPVSFYGAQGFLGDAPGQQGFWMLQGAGVLPGEDDQASGLLEIGALARRLIGLR